MNNDIGSGMSYSSLYIASKFYEGVADELLPDEVSIEENGDVS